MHSEYWETAAKKQVRSFFCLTLFDKMLFFRNLIGRLLSWAERGVPDTARNFPGANVYTVPCPIIHALNLIGGKWKLPVLWHLFDAESVRYNELKRSVVGITNIMLTQCLRELETAGLVRRDDFGEVPPRVEYSLTGQGRELLPALRELYKWGEKQLAVAPRPSRLSLEPVRRILTHCQPVSSGPYSFMPLFPSRIRHFVKNPPGGPAAHRAPAWRPPLKVLGDGGGGGG